MIKQHIEKINVHSSNWPQIPDHSYRILIIGGSGSGKTNALLHLIKKQGNDNYSFIDKIYLYINDPSEAKYQYLINKRENPGFNGLNDPKFFIE